jgi:hypothetical protein
MSATIFDLVNVHTVRAHRLKVEAGGVGKGFIFQYSPNPRCPTMHISIPIVRSILKTLTASARG